MIKKLKIIVWCLWVVLYIFFIERKAKIKQKISNKKTPIFYGSLNTYDKK